MVIELSAAAAVSDQLHADSDYTNTVVRHYPHIQAHTRRCLRKHVYIVC
jgi:hypothetical protein